MKKEIKVYELLKNEFVESGRALPSQQSFGLIGGANSISNYSIVVGTFREVSALLENDEAILNRFKSQVKKGTDIEKDIFHVLLKFSSNLVGREISQLMVVDSMLLWLYESYNLTITQTVEIDIDPLEPENN